MFLLTVLALYAVWFCWDFYRDPKIANAPLVEDTLPFD